MWCVGGAVPLLYSYVGRRGAISYRRGIIEPPRKSRPRKTPHGKRATKKEVGAAAGRVYLFFRVILSGRSFFRGIVRGGRWLESSKCILAHFRPLERRRLLFFPRPLSADSNLFVRILLNSDYSLFFSFHLWAFCSPLFVTESL